MHPELCEGLLESLGRAYRDGAVGRSLRVYIGDLIVAEAQESKDGPRALGMAVSGFERERG